MRQDLSKYSVPLVTGISDVTGCCPVLPRLVHGRVNLLGPIVVPEQVEPQGRAAVLQSSPMELAAPKERSSSLHLRVQKTASTCRTPGSHHATCTMNISTMFNERPDSRKKRYNDGIPRSNEVNSTLHAGPPPISNPGLWDDLAHP